MVAVEGRVAPVFRAQGRGDGAGSEAIGVIDTTLWRPRRRVLSLRTRGSRPAARHNASPASAFVAPGAHPSRRTLRLKTAFKTPDRMRLAGIADYEAANRYVDEKYLDEHNAKFVYEPSAGADFHQSLSKRLDLKWVFCLEAERVVSNDLVVRFENRSACVFAVETEAQSRCGSGRESDRAASEGGRIASGRRRRR